MKNPMRTMMTLIGKELAQQAKWLAVWVAAAHVKVGLALLGLGMLWLTGQRVPGAEEIRTADDVLLAVVFTMPRSDSSILTFLGIGFFFFWGGFRIVQQEAQQRTVAWLRTMPVPDSRVALAKLLVAGAYVWFTLLPAIALFLAMPGGWTAFRRGYSGFAWWIFGQYLIVWTVLFSFVVFGATAGMLAARGNRAGIGSSRHAHLKSLAGYGALWIVAFVGLALAVVAIQTLGGAEPARWLLFYGGGGRFVSGLPVFSAHAAAILICGAWVVRAWANRPLIA